MISFLKKYKEIVLYLLFGGGTTLVNLIFYYICYEQLGISNVASTTIAWVVSVAFAFITNKLWVFNSKRFTTRVILREGVMFFSCRLLTGLLDVVIMVLAVDVFALHAHLWKVIANIIVIVANWTASKLYIFNHGRS